MIFPSHKGPAHLQKFVIDFEYRCDRRKRLVLIFGDLLASLRPPSPATAS